MGLRAQSCLFPHHHPYPQYPAGWEFSEWFGLKTGASSSASAAEAEKVVIPSPAVGRFIQSAGRHFYFYWRRYPLPLNRRKGVLSSFAKSGSKCSRSAGPPACFPREENPPGRHFPEPPANFWTKSRGSLAQRNSGMGSKLAVACSLVR